MLRTLVCGAIGLAALLGVLLAVGVGAQSSPITLEQRTTSSLSVRWHWGGQTAAAFEVAWRPRGEDDRAAWRSARKQASERRHTISGLDAGVHYVVRVRALNAAGRPLGDLRAAFATDWSAPRLLRVTARADAVLTIGWSAPNDWTPQGYRLRWRAAGAQTLSGDLTLPASASGRRLPGLSAGTAYLIRLTALNARGGESPPAVLTATAAGAPPAQPVLTDASWSELTLRAEWGAVARATGYDVRWNSADDETPVSAEEAIEASPAEYIAPRTGLYTVAVRARIGSGPTAVRGEWSQPLSLRVLPAPHYLRVQNFDGERVRLSWPGVGANGYVVEWGRRGGTKQTETRDGRSGVLEVGPLTTIAAYEFRVRARHQRGESGWSPTVTMTPTIWPQLPPRAALNQGSLYVLWPPAAGAEWYEAQWINAADRDETARVRVDPPGGGGNVAARIGRDGGFEDGRWLVRVRAGPFGLWSQTYALDLAGQPPRLALELESSRDLCTAGTLTEISWKISGGSAPYALSVENSAVDVSADNVRVNCGALTEAEAGEAEAALAAKTVSAVVTDSRGVQRRAALDVARARALPAPANVRYSSGHAAVLVLWDDVLGAGSQSPHRVHPATRDDLRVTGSVRTRSSGDTAWSYEVVDREGHHEYRLDALPGLRELSVAAVRHPLELETPEALTWSDQLSYAVTMPPQNVTATATHDTVVVSWDRQPLARHSGWNVELLDVQGGGMRSDIKRHRMISDQGGTSARHEVTFLHLPADTEFKVFIHLNLAEHDELPAWMTALLSGPAPTVRTKRPPAGWAPWPTGAQNLRATTTHETIAVSWDAPSPSAADRWHVELHDTITGHRLYAAWVYLSETPLTIRSVRPSRAYRVTVTHRDLQVTTAEITVVTSSAPPTGSAGTSDVTTGETMLPFFPIWPASINAHYFLTDDPFQWRINDLPDDHPDRDETTDRPDRYHAGLDLGEHEQYRGGDNVLGQPVYAVAAGILRIVNDDLSSGTTMYCPEDRPLHEQLHVADTSYGSAWWNGQEFHVNPRLAPTEIYCQYLAGRSSGRVALVAHTLKDGTWLVTKYAHLQKDGLPLEIAKALAFDPDECTVTSIGRCRIDPRKWVHVERGDQIGRLGNSAYHENGGFDAHVHFEIRHFNIPRSQWHNGYAVWYRPTTEARPCGVKYPHPNSLDCTWSEGPPRSMPTVLDVEAYLPPLPASPVPTKGRNTTGPDSSAVTRHVTEVEGATRSTGGAPRSLLVDMSIAFWRPSFYTTYYSEPGRSTPGHRGQISRTGIQGIKSTGPGVDAYYADVSCDDNVVTTHGPFTGPAHTKAEIAPVTIEDVRVSHDEACLVTIRASNRHWELQRQEAIRDRAGQNIELRDPSVTLTWVAELSTGEDVVRMAESLTGDDLDLYTFTARRGYTYRFCTMPNAANTCAPEAEPGVARKKVNNVAELLIIGPDDEVEEGITRNTQGLKWTVPDDGPTEATYALVVRRRVRFEGSEPAYGYKLKHTIPRIISCPDLRAGAVSGAQTTTTLYICTPAMPTIRSSVTRTNAAITFKWSSASVPVEYMVRLTKGDSVGDPVAPNNHSGARSHRFTGLDANTEYKVEVKAINKIGGITVAESGWASYTGYTLLPTPGGASVTGVTHNQATLNWNQVTGASGYEVKRTEGSGETTPGPAATTSSHPFGGLSSSTRYTFYVRAKLSTNDAVTSAWARAQETTSSRPAPPPRPRPPQPDPEMTEEEVGRTAVREYWWPFGDFEGGGTPNPPGTCYLELYRLDRYAMATFETSWKFDTSSWEWVLDPSTKVQVGLESEYIYEWVLIGRRMPFPCPTGDDGVSGASAPPAGVLPAGSYVRPWGGEWYSFTIPSGAEVRLSSRKIGEQEAMVFSVAGDAEVVIIPAQVATDRPTSDNATLAAIATSFREETDPAKLPSAAERRTCADAPSRDDAGALSLDLNAQWCLVVSSSGAVTVRYGEERLSLAVPTGRVWLIFAASQSESVDAAGIWIMDRQSKAYVILNPADGAELRRHAPADAEGLPALLDAIAASASAPAAAAE